MKVLFVHDCMRECKYRSQLVTSISPWDILATGIFSAILGRGPRAFLIGKISDIHPEFGKFSNHSKLMIFSNLT